MGNYNCGSVLDGGEHFITKLARIDPSQALEPLNVYSGTIPVTIPVNVGTGPLYFVRIYGLDKTTGSMFYLPDSSYFPIVNPYSGKWNHPAYSDSWVSGRTTLLNFILGEPFSTATTMRLEATGETMDKILIVNSSIPITEAMKGGVATTLSLSVPIPLDFSLNFYARLIPNDGPFASPKSIGAIGSPFLGFSLPTIMLASNLQCFQSAVISNFNLQINITTPPQTTPVFINNNITFTWKYTIPKPVVPSWNIDLYSGGDRSSMYMGKRLRSDLKATTYKWSIDEDIPSGLYFVRVWGYDTDGLKKMAEVDPISQISSSI
ncbi:hypothetical protein BDR26DRAFT_874066 [Obelidium mucronatum]|nr:hypothetical protein BDR26DRAFT_874066 [Obelidium mucronatum]